MRKNQTKKKKIDPKIQFRRSTQWRNFRVKLRKQQKKDPVTGSILTRNCNCHHLDENPNNYTDITDESHFVCLNPMTHEVLHYLWGDASHRNDWKERIKNLAELCQLMDDLNN